MLREPLLLCVLAVAPTLAAAVFHPRSPGWSPETVREGEISLLAAIALGEKALWIDARPEQEYEREHVPGAAPLNEDRWDQLLEALLGRWIPGQPIIVYCDNRLCRASHGVAQRLREAGLHPVYVLHGGWEAWKRERRRR